MKVWTNQNLLLPFFLFHSRMMMTGGILGALDVSHWHAWKRSQEPWWDGGQAQQRVDRIIFPSFWQLKATKINIVLADTMATEAKKDGSRQHILGLKMLNSTRSHILSHAYSTTFQAASLYHTVFYNGVMLKKFSSGYNRHDAVLPCFTVRMVLIWSWFPPKIMRINAIKLMFH